MIDARLAKFKDDYKTYCIFENQIIGEVNNMMEQNDELMMIEEGYDVIKGLTLEQVSGRFDFVNNIPALLNESVSCNWVRNPKINFVHRASDYFGEEIIEAPFMFLDFSIVTEKWDRNYSYHRLMSFIEETLLATPELKVYFPLEFEAELNILYKLKDLDLTLQSIVEKLSTIFWKALSSALELAEFSDKRKLIERTFQFPKETKSACHQYLAYFSTFLADLGIEAKTKIEEQAQHVLFTVEPKNAEEALEKVKEALDLYLNLPSAEPPEIIEVVDNSAMHQLVAIQHHFQGQLSLALAEVQMKETTIQGQKAVIQLKDATIRSLTQKNLGYEKTLRELETKENQQIIKPKEIDLRIISVNTGEIWKRLNELLKRDRKG